MRDLWRAFKLVLPYRWRMVWYVISAIGLGIFGSLPLVLVKSLLDKLDGKTPGKTDRIAQYVDGFLASSFGQGESYIYGICAAALGCLILKGVFDFTNTYLASWISQRLRMEAMERVMGKLLTLDQAYFDQHKIGDLVSRMVSDGDNLRRTVKAFLDFAQRPFMVAGLIAVALYYDWYLFCIGAVAVPVIFIPLKKTIQNITRQQKRYQEKTADLAQAMLQNLTGMRIICAYDAAGKEAGNFKRLAGSLFRTGMRRNRARALQGPLTEIMLGTGMIAVLLIGGLHILRSSGDTSAFLCFFAALISLRAPLNAMVWAIGEMAELLPSAERTFEVLDVKPGILDAPNAQDCPVLKNEIRFENISFDYGRGRVLQDFSLTLRAGEKIGIVGRTGVGKSTLLALLLRLYDPQKGRILIDGVDLKNVKLSTLRTQMALVSQNPFLFHASVADNIRYGRPGATDAEVTAAAQAAMVHDEIMQQPEGYGTLCGERGGELFSGGQRQRIAVARAILRNAPILLLDEATSALDAESERRVQEALDRLAASRTSLIVAHRLSTLRNADRILVFGETGGVEAVGAPGEIASLSPTYRKLAAGQGPDVQSQDMDD